MPRYAPSAAVSRAVVVDSWIRKVLQTMDALPFLAVEVAGCYGSANQSRGASGNCEGTMAVAV